MPGLLTGSDSAIHNADINAASKQEVQDPLPFELSEDGSSSRGVVLPPELLSLMFFHVLSSYHNLYSEWIAENQRTEAATILYASQVCRYWRSVALSNTQLWGMIINIDYSSALWVEELICRSGMSPLVVQSIIGQDLAKTGFIAPKWTILLKESYRFKILNLNMSIYWNTTPIAIVLSQPAPLLESFKISFESHCLRQTAPFHLENGLFADNAPKLREIVIDRLVILPFIHLSTTRLVHLHVSPESTLHRRLSVSRWMDILATQPRLKYLILGSNVFDSTTAGVGGSLNKVELPYLQYFHVNCDETVCDQVLPSIILPSSCILDLSISQGHELLLGTSGIFQGLTRHFNSWKLLDQPLRYHWAIHIVNDSFSIVATSGEDDNLDSFHLFSISYRPLEEPNSLSLAKLLDIMCDLRLIEQSSVLTLRADHEYTDFEPETMKALVSLLSSCQRVSQLRIIGESSPAAILRPILMAAPVPVVLGKEETTNTLPEMASKSILLPNLTSLVYEHTSAEGELNTVAARTFEFLLWRRDAGHPVEDASFSVGDLGTKPAIFDSYIHLAENVKIVPGQFNFWKIATGMPLNWARNP